jgi:hypothetical protein
LNAGGKQYILVVKLDFRIVHILSQPCLWQERTVDNASSRHCLHCSFVADMLIAFSVFEVDIIVYDDGLQVLRQLLDLLL